MNQHSSLTAWHFALPILFLSMGAKASPLVEIVAMAHPPIIMALAPLREWLAEQQDIEVIEIDIETPEGIERMADVGLTGHIPLIILINGEYLYQSQDGSPLAFINFPDKPESPPGIRGNWRIDDVKRIVKESR